MKTHGKHTETHTVCFFVVFVRFWVGVKVDTGFALF